MKYAAWGVGLVQADFPMEDMLKRVSSNPAKRIGAFPNKGSIARGKDADLLILSPDLKIDTVMAGGQLMIPQGELLVKGTFED
jgi:beta-aspartyl-dipeptidase (metallo-type)